MLQLACDDSLLVEPLSKLFLVVEQRVDWGIGKHVGNDLQHPLCPAAHGEQFMDQGNPHERIVANETYGRYFAAGTFIPSRRA